MNKVQSLELIAFYNSLREREEDAKRLGRNVYFQKVLFDAMPLVPAEVRAIADENLKTTRAHVKDLKTFREGMPAKFIMMKGGIC